MDSAAPRLSGSGGEDLVEDLPGTTSGEQVLLPWSPVAGLAVDLVLLLAVAVLPVLGLLGVEGALRNGSALLVLGLAPGWGTLRAVGLPASTYTLLAGVAASLTLGMLVGLVAVTRWHWQWRGGLAVIEIVAAAALAVALARSRLPRPGLPAPSDADRRG